MKRSTKIRRPGTPPARLHDPRHGAATLALADSAGLKLIQAMLDRASIILTTDANTSALPDLARATVRSAGAARIMKTARTPDLTVAPRWPNAPAA
jgi:hypothetical protein